MARSGPRPAAPWRTVDRPPGSRVCILRATKRSLEPARSSCQVLELSGVVGSSLVDDTRSIRTRIRIMVDRTDIDALLIGALYGELTPADEARLTAHLESHPADRTALDNLTRTRAAVRDSRILTFQAEPSQAISALLLQEASRRAPRRVDAS